MRRSLSVVAFLTIFALAGCRSSSPGLEAEVPGDGASAGALTGELAAEKPGKVAPFSAASSPSAPRAGVDIPPGTSAGEAVETPSATPSNGAGAADSSDADRVGREIEKINRSEKINHPDAPLSVRRQRFRDGVLVVVVAVPGVARSAEETAADTARYGSEYAVATHEPVNRRLAELESRLRRIEGVRDVLIVRE